MRSEKATSYTEDRFPSWLRSPRLRQTLALLFADAGVIVLALFMAFVIRFDGGIPERYTTVFA